MEGKTLLERATNSVRAMDRAPVITPASTFDGNHPQIKKDIIKMIAQYLEGQNYIAAAAVVQDEANVKRNEQLGQSAQLRRVRKGIRDGDWDTVVRSVKKHLKSTYNHKSFLYAVHKQEYLELIDRQELQKAFTYLSTQLKPMEALSRACNKNEFEDLCYLLTCKEVESFKHWEGIVQEREKLAEQFEVTFQFEKYNMADYTSKIGDADDKSRILPPNRLITLLQQAVAYQMEFARHHPKVVPRVTSFASDYSPMILPNTLHKTFVGHKANVKCITFLGETGDLLASGSSDNTILLWHTGGEDSEYETEANAEKERGEDERSAAQRDKGDEPSTDRGGHRDGNRGSHGSHSTSSRDSVRLSGASSTTIQSPICLLQGHSSRVWDLSVDAAGDTLVSASGDGTLKVWKVHQCIFEQGQPPTWRGKSASASDSKLSSEHVLTNAVKHGMSMNSMYQSRDPQHAPGPAPYALPRGCAAAATLEGHTGDVYTVQHHPGGDHVVSGSYDRTAKLFDLRAEKQIRTFSGHHASVCAAIFNPHGNLVVTGSKDGTIAFWDILSGVRIKAWAQADHHILGEVTSIQMNCNGTQLLSASKNNCHVLWDIRTNRPLAQRYKGHQNTAKNFVRAHFGPLEEVVVSGSEDGAVHMWETRSGSLLHRLRGHQGVVYSAVWHARRSLVASCSHDCLVKTWHWDESKPFDCN